MTRLEHIPNYPITNPSLLDRIRSLGYQGNYQLNEFLDWVENNFYVTVEAFPSKNRGKEYLTAQIIEDDEVVYERCIGPTVDLEDGVYKLLDTLIKKYCKIGEDEEILYEDYD